MFKVAPFISRFYFLWNIFRKCFLEKVVSDDENLKFWTQLFCANRILCIIRSKIINIEFILISLEGLVITLIWITLTNNLNRTQIWIWARIQEQARTIVQVLLTIIPNHSVSCNISFDAMRSSVCSETLIMALLLSNSLILFAILHSFMVETPIIKNLVR